MTPQPNILQQCRREADEIQWQRFDALLNPRLPNGNQEAFTAVIIEHCKPKTVAAQNNLHLNGGGLKQLKHDAIELALSETGSITKAAAKLKVNRGVVYDHKRRKAALCVLSLFVLSLVSGTASAALIALPQPVASLAPAVDPNLASVSLAWTHSPDTNTVGYSIGYGTNRTALNTSAGVGYVTNATISGLLPAATYYFQAFSLNAQGVTSEPSNMVTNFIQPRLVMLPDRWKVHVSLPAGRTSIVQSCTNANFSGTIRNLLTNSSGGSIWFYATNDVAQNFYRVKPN